MEEKLIAEEEEYKKIHTQLPEYSYKHNLNLRYKVIKDLGLSNELVNIFNRLCDYASSVKINSPVINLNEFVSFTAQRDGMATPRANRFKVPLLKLVQILSEIDVQLIAILHIDEQEKPVIIALKEKSNTDMRLISQLNTYLEKSIVKIKAQKIRFRNSQDLLGHFSLNIEQLQEIANTISIKELTFNKLKEIAKDKSKIIIIAIDKEIKDVVFHANYVEEVITSLLFLIKSYYEDDLNENLRLAIRKQFKQKNLNLHKIKTVLSYGNVNDSYFLFFTQLFYAIMLNLSDTLRQQYALTNEIYNQLVAALILSNMSLNQRNELHDQEMLEAKRKKHLEKINDILLSKYIKKDDNILFLPLSIKDIQAIKLKVVTKLDEKQKQENSERLGDIYEETEVLEYIQNQNNNEHTIKEILSFRVRNDIFYLHRARLISSFMSILRQEKIGIITKIRKEWNEDINLILNKNQQEDFKILVEEEYASDFFKIYYQLVAETIKQESPVDKEVTFAYLVERLFLNEREILSYKKKAPDLDIKTEKRSDLMKAFLETIYYKKSKQPKGILDLLGIDFLDLREQCLNGTNTSFFKKIVFFMKDFLVDTFNFMSFSQEGKSKDKKQYLKAAKEKVNNLSGTLNNVVSQVKKNIPFKDKKKESKEKDEVNKEGKGKKDKKRELDAERKELLKFLPEVKEPSVINKIINELHEKWNIKIGKARDDLKEHVDSIVDEITGRFSTNAFSPEGIEDVYNKIKKNNETIANIGNQEALKDYIFHLVCLTKYQKILEKLR